MLQLFEGKFFLFVQLKMVVFCSKIEQMMIMMQTVMWSFKKMFEEIDKETELHEMRSMDIVQMAEPGNVLALFSPPNALELIYSREAASEGPTALHLN